MEREKITTVDYLDITVVKSGDKIKRYEIRPLFPEGFLRISENTVETGTVYFPGKLSLDDILSDIAKIEAE